MDIFYPFELLAESVTYGLLGFSRESFLANALTYFIFDVIRIGLLLILINYVMAAMRYFFPMEKVRDILSSRKWYGLDYLLAAVLGVVTPFCSCSSIPLFIGFLSAGIPIGVTFAFLITSPLVNEASLALFPALFGLQTTLLYNGFGIAIGVAGGFLIQRLSLEKYVDKDLLIIAGKNKTYRNKKESIKISSLISEWWSEGMGITKKVFPYVLIGVAVGSLIHGFVPEDFITKSLSFDTPWAVPLATLLGVPLYANSVSVIPVIEALVEKGIPLGTGLAFMTATVTLSIPEALILKKVMKWQLLAVFFAITIVGIMLLGFVFNSL